MQKNYFIYYYMKKTDFTSKCKNAPVNERYGPVHEQAIDFFQSDTLTFYNSFITIFEAKFELDFSKSHWESLS